jgi:hypothetical protein
VAGAMPDRPKKIKTPEKQKDIKKQLASFQIIITFLD